MSDNVRFLHDRLKYLGFGDNTLLNMQVEEHIKREVPDFELHTDAFFDHMVRAEARLHFQRQDQQGIYVFDRYIAKIDYEMEPDRKRERTFYIYRGVGVTFKEAYNLLDGRAARVDMVNRDEEKYSVWVQLDFEDRDSHGNYKYKYFRFYDLDKVLERYPIEQLRSAESRKAMLASLERGNRYLVSLGANKPEPRYIEANPAERSIRIYPPGPATAKRRRSESKRSVPNQLAAAGTGIAEEKSAGDQELSEETVDLSGE